MTENPKKKINKLDRIAEENGIAIVVLDDSSQVVSSSNNNSICASLYGKPGIGDKCSEYCGKAFENAFDTRKPLDFECHAGLNCRAMPVQDGGSNFVAIVGRTFTTSANYRKTTEKAINGEWKGVQPTQFFDNILISGSSDSIDEVSNQLNKYLVAQDVKELNAEVKAEQAVRIDVKPDLETKPEIQKPAKRPENESISKLIEKFNQEKDLVTGPAQPIFQRTIEPPFPIITEPAVSAKEKIAEVLEVKNEETHQPEPEIISSDLISSWRSTMGSLMKSSYHDACRSVLDLLSLRYGVGSLIWLEQRSGVFESIVAKGSLEGKSVHIDLSVENEKLLQAVESRSPLELREKRSRANGKRRTLYIFPMLVGAEIRSAIGLEMSSETEVDKDEISRFTATIGSQIEILRLRHEMSSRDKIARSVRRFSESLRTIDRDNFWIQLTRSVGELLKAERVSLLLKDEASGRLIQKAAIGSHADLSGKNDIGERVAFKVLESGEPFLIADIRSSNIIPAPPEWRYRTSSFISMPISIGGRRVAVLNLTDKAEGGMFGVNDIELLESIVPQIAMAIERGSLKVRAGELEKRSITDSLTGLMNRGYIEERLIEEMNRASRHRFQMSLMMIDVDNFKSYNDSFGHPAGDIALQRVAIALKDTLRAADVAARYGGEEFSVLLPQTSLEEALAIAERLRQRVERTDFPKRQVTISIGVASYSSEFSDPKDWITAADMALYEAKDMGRNNVQVYEKLGRSFREKIH